MKNPLRNGGKVKQKKLEEINEYLKRKQKKKAKKTIKQEKQTVEDLKTKIEAINKTQTEGILEMENLGK